MSRKQNFCMVDDEGHLGVDNDGNFVITETVKTPIMGKRPALARGRGQMFSERTSVFSDQAPLPEVE